MAVSMAISCEMLVSQELSSSWLFVTYKLVERCLFLIVPTLQHLALRHDRAVASVTIVAFCVSDVADIYSLIPAI